MLFPLQFLVLNHICFSETYEDKFFWCGFISSWALVLCLISLSSFQEAVRLWDANLGSHEKMFFVHKFTDLNKIKACGNRGAGSNLQYLYLAPLCTRTHDFYLTSLKEVFGSCTINYCN